MTMSWDAKSAVNREKGRKRVTRKHIPQELCIGCLTSSLHDFVQQSWLQVYINLFLKTL